MEVKMIGIVVSILMGIGFLFAAWVEGHAIGKVYEEVFKDTYNERR